MASSSNFGNLYNILQIPPTADPKEIKKARDRLARKQHTDKGGDEERMKAINEAFRVLSSPELRQKYDGSRDDADDLIPPKVSGHLPEGPRKSERFIERLNVWLREGVPDKKVKFVSPSLSKMDVGSAASLPHPARALFQQFVSQIVPSIRECLASLLPKEVYEWSFTSQKAVMEEVVASTAWNGQVPYGHPKTSLNENVRSYRLIADQVMAAKKVLIEPVNVRRLSFEMVEWMQMTKEVPLFEGKREGSLWVLFNVFPESWSREDVGLGYLPRVYVYPTDSPLIITKTENGDEICGCCSEPFGLLRWKVGCYECGNASCRECLSMARISTEGQRVPVCDACRPAVKKKYYQDPWVDALKNSDARADMTVKYIALVDELGFATKRQFKEWMTLFLEEGRPELAIQCALSAGVDMKELAIKLYQKFQYGYALSALSFAPQKSSEAWISEGDKLAASDESAALLFYRQGGMSRKGYRRRARQHPNYGIGWMCLIAASRKAKKEKMQELFWEFIENNNLAIAFLVGTLSLDSHTMYSATKKLSSLDTEVWLYWLSDYFGNKLAFPPLEDVKDHLRWPYLGNWSIDRALDHLLNHVETKPFEEAILFLRRKFQGENFVVLRDEYMKNREYRKMVLCHLLSTNRLSFEDMTKKARSKDLLAAMHYLLCQGKDLSLLGNELFQSNEKKLALMCFLQKRDYRAIYNKAKEGAYEDQLLYLGVLYSKFPTEPTQLKDLIHLLLTKPENMQKVQKVLIAALQTSPPEKSFYYHQLLRETGLSEEMQLGQLEALQAISNKEEQWFQGYRQQFQDRFKKALRTAFYSYNVPEMTRLLDQIHPITLETAAIVLKEYQTLEGPHKALRLVVEAMLVLYESLDERFVKASDKVAQAMLIDASEGNIDLYIKAFLRIQVSMEHASGDLLQGIMPRTIKEKSEFAGRLVDSPDLKLLLRSEKSMAKFSPLQKVKSSIDLTKGVDNALGMIGYYLSAAQSLLEVKNTRKTVSPKITDAFRRGITELVITAYAIGDQILNPATQLYVVRSAIGILLEAFQGTKEVAKQEESFFELLHKETERLSQVAPIVLNSLVQTYDLVYYEVIVRKAVTGLLNKKIEKGDVEAQYILFEGTWKRWLSLEEYSFEEEREKTMRSLLNAEGHTLEEVEDLMSWPVIPRDSEGWMTTEVTPLHLEGQTFTTAEAIQFDINTGEISFILGEAKKKREALFDFGDVSEIMKRGITGAQFTLDPPDSKRPYHPFQKMLFAPASIAHTGYLATLLHADYLLKMLSMRTEVSAQAPFAMRDASEGLLKRLPKDLRESYDRLRESMESSAGKVHRFWIEAGKLEYTDHEENGVVTYKIGRAEMSVKKHLMVRDREGNLVDAEEDDNNPNSFESRFAVWMTDNYDRLAKVFPELARLRELVHLQSLSLFVQNFYRNVKRQSKEISVNRSKIEAHLEKIREGLEYPRAQDANVTRMLKKSIRAQGHDPDRVSNYNALWNQLYRQCKEADESAVKQIAEGLSKDYHVEYIQSDVKCWLQDGDDEGLVNVLQQGLKSEQRRRLLKICQTVKKMGMATKLSRQDEMVEGDISWVPAAFRQGDGRRVYGGVNMNPNLVRGGGAGPSGGAPRVPTPGPIIQARHIITMSAAGKIFGTTTAIDRVTGNTYNVHEIKSSVRDAWNQSLPKPPNNKYFMRSDWGGTNDHYTHHHSGSTHIHPKQGDSTCIDRNGNRTNFRMGDKNHRCHNN